MMDYLFAEGCMSAKRFCFQYVQCLCRRVCSHVRTFTSQTLVNAAEGLKHKNKLWELKGKCVKIYLWSFLAV